GAADRSGADPGPLGVVQHVRRHLGGHALPEDLDLERRAHGPAEVDRQGEEPDVSTDRGALRPPPKPPPPGRGPPARAGATGRVDEPNFSTDRVPLPAAPEPAEHAAVLPHRL